MSTIKALLGDRRQTNTIKQRRKQARDRESREGCCRRGWGGCGTGGMTGLRREGAHLEEQPGKGSGRSLDRAEERGWCACTCELERVAQQGGSSWLH